MMRKLLIFTFLNLLFFTAYSQSGCPGCAVSLPDTLGLDTIFLTAAPDGQAGVYYEGDVSFRLPKTTTPVAAVDPDIPSGLGISKITISGVSNVPPGLSWEASQMEFDTEEQTDGCVRFCGTPLQPGLYLVDVTITARVVIIDQTANVTIPILILPAESTTDGFNMINNSGCGAVAVTFENNVPSNGRAGYSYRWDFGNGNVSMEENPDFQLYDMPGNYPVSYQALIDTTGYFLTKVNVTTVGCNDLLGGRPDLKVNVINPDGVLFYVSDIVQNASTPVTFEMNIPLDTGNYVIAITDDDSGLGGADDQCGNVIFNRNTSGNLSDGSLALRLEILHPVDTVSSTDTVFVYDQPDPPLITEAGPSPLCIGDTVLLIASYSENIQWYRDSVPLLNATDDSLAIMVNGNYWVVYTSPDGCIAESEPLSLSFGELPESVLFVNDNNELSLFDPGILPASAEIRWYQDGVLLEGFAETTYCIDASATYTIEVVDLATGCSASYSQAMTYDPLYPNCVSPVVDRLPEGVTAVQLFPNPTRGPLRWSIQTDRALPVTVSLHTVTGQQLQEENWRLNAGEQTREWELSELPAGMYLIRIGAEGQSKSWRIVKY
ncbi:T9SS type A sorting domain-containing protein [Flavilitoribacter nigricans]|uniref:PKD domain-containing protein n=1 Tax=Flavilitoribacter nigricans (strain ATCC 23147 / DSM 23189 / NBRC 102662 / NCIMB 1420 / SS-2) TaxID=1122177 RepID=A0A2D0MYL6_FLAN2|nr:T9SS type A sorting domain-containing protein [Flavilitoribacter nigricans]PHN01345.1 hypothetical protein CRP01_37405 [Flavilitoribacter nigricans DSM 23189 = NBRC 102662]